MRSVVEVRWQPTTRLCTVAAFGAEYSAAFKDLAPGWTRQSPWQCTTRSALLTSERLDKIAFSFLTSCLP